MITSLGFMTGCSPTINHHGYVARPGAFDQISVGMSRGEVVGILGSPSTTASINFDGDSAYYITSVTEDRAFLNPKEISREVIAIRFDRNEKVVGVAQYGLVDGRIINMNERSTPVAGEELTVLQELFGGIMGSKKLFTPG